MSATRPRASCGAPRRSRCVTRGPMWPGTASATAAFPMRSNGIDLDLLQFVPLDDPIKISRLTLTNLSGRPRRLSVNAYADWVLGTSRGASAPFILTEIDPHSGAMLARNRWSTAFGSRVAFVDLCGRQTAWTADRTEFLGRGGNLAAPLALASSRPCPASPARASIRARPFRRSWSSALAKASRWSRSSGRARP